MSSTAADLPTTLYLATRMIGRALLNVPGNDVALTRAAMDTAYRQLLPEARAGRRVGLFTTSGPVGDAITQRGLSLDAKLRTLCVGVTVEGIGVWVESRRRDDIDVQAWASDFQRIHDGQLHAGRSGVKYAELAQSAELN